MSIISNFVETVTITVSEFAYLKDTETRFKILKNKMLNEKHCPLDMQIILGIENENLKNIDFNADAQEE